MSLATSAAPLARSPQHSSPMLTPRSCSGTASMGHPRSQHGPNVVVSLEAVQAERLRAELAEHLLHGTQDHLRGKLEEMYEMLRQEKHRADIAEANLARVRLEVADLRAVGQLHEEIATEATCRAEASDVVNRKLQEELDMLGGKQASADELSPIEIEVARAPSVRKVLHFNLEGLAEKAPLPSMLLNHRLSDDFVINSSTRRLSKTLSDDSRRSASKESREPLQRRVSDISGEEERSQPLFSRSLPEHLLSMVQASAEEVVHVQIDLGLVRQSNAQLTARLQQVESERDSLLASGSELKVLRASEKEHRARAQASGLESERLKGELAAARRRVSELTLQLQNSAAEKDRLAHAMAEATRNMSELRASESDSRYRCQVAEGEARAYKAELARVKAAAESDQKELAEVRALLKERHDEAKAFSDGKRMLEAEFKVYKEFHGVGDNIQLKAMADLEFQVDTLSRQVDSTRAELGSQQSSTEYMRGRIAQLEEQVRVVEIQRRDLHNQVQDLKGNIRVFCRVRPTSNFSDIALYSPEPNKVNLVHADEEYNFSFDKVFSMEAAQADVFEEVDGLVQSALDGYKVSIFAYGQTGSGKTHTMQGSDEPGCWGLIPRSLSKIFQTSQKMRLQGWSWTLEVSILEVYNENIRDLLRGGGDSAAGPPPAHTIQHSDIWGSTVTNMTTLEVASMEQVITLLARAAKQRAVGATCMNAVSSRSHCVFALYLKGVNKQLGAELYGALHMVDLSGSERLDKSCASGERLKETQSINKSLSSLADVFVAKAEGRPHVPFRNSKLTFLLEPCLSGQGKTLMIVNVRPDLSNSHETLCSLRFAKQVNQCNTGGRPKRNVRISVAGSNTGQDTDRRRSVATPAEKAAAAAMAAAEGILSKTSRPRSRTLSIDSSRNAVLRGKENLLRGTRNQSPVRV